MSLHIYIAHTGEQLFADPVSFASPDALRAWISRNASIPSQRQILMTARGKNVKLQNLATENEIFVYDRQIVSEKDGKSLPEVTVPDPFAPPNPPDTLANEKSLQAWKNLFMERRTWALNLASKGSQISQTSHQRNMQTDIIIRGANIALENLKSHVGSLEQKLQDAQSWANELLNEQQQALGGWQRVLAHLETIPIKKEFPCFQRPTTPTKAKREFSRTLKDYINVEQTRQAASRASTLSAKFSQRMDDIEKEVGEVVKQTEHLIHETPIHLPENTDGLVDELETLARKIIADYEQMLTLQNSSKNLSTISKMAQHHTKVILPSMVETSLDLQNSLVKAVKNYNNAMRKLVQRMQSISAIEMRLASLQADIGNLDIDGESFETLSMVFHVPLIYGSLLIEAARRREWSEKIQDDSTALAEELATFCDEERARRKKWMMRMGDYLSLSEDGGPGVEVNLQHKGAEWPEVSRLEIDDYLQDIKTKEGMEIIAQELTQRFKDLDMLTREQKRRAKAFKHGSVADLSRSSFLFRGDDMVRSLQEEKTKLEERLKGSESRVRRLEDLLHRSTHMTRPPSGYFGQDVPASPASPYPDPTSRRSSTSSRRMSSNNPPEDHALAQRIGTLEGELAAEREAVAKLQREARVERQSNADRIEEIETTKNDLMGNLDAKQREFDSERKFLESENNRMKLKLEEAEEELDRVMESREQEKQELEDKLGQLQRQLDDTSIAAKDAEKYRTSADNHQAELSKLDNERKELSDRIQNMEKAQNEHASVLQAAHHQLSPTGAPPTDLSQLVKAIEILSEGLSIHAKGSDQRVSELSDENQTLTETISRLELELSGLKQRLESADSEKKDLLQSLYHEKLAQQKLQQDLEEQRSQPKELQSKFSSDKTGLVVANDVAMGKDATDARINGLEKKCQEWEQKFKSLQESRTNSTLSERSSWAIDISTKLYSQIGLMARMLQQLGFTIVLQDDEMSIQRSSKVASGSVPAESIVSSDDPPFVENPVTLFSQATDEEDESAKVMEFMKAVEKFNQEAYAEAVVKRVKDIEAVARKWQKEARSYREKCHRAQNDAHDKIAYRSFKEGDMALFLPTRNQIVRSWAAFNVGAPHYFLREQEVHRLHTRDWLLARISKVEERVVDLSKSMNGGLDKRSVDASDGGSVEDYNPFGLSDGLRWYLLDAYEEKPRAPSTPGLGKTTVASAHVDARGSIRLNRAPNGGGATKTLARSLDSRRNSSASKKGVPVPTLQRGESGGDNVAPIEGDRGAQPRREDAPIFDEDLGRSLHCATRSTPGAAVRSDDMTRPGSPLATSRTPAGARPSKPRPWEKLFSLDYRSDSPANR